MDVNDEETGQRVRVCPYCFSHDIEENTLIGGPMAQLDNDDGTFRCHKCGRSAVPLEFSSWEEYIAFIWERDGLPVSEFRTLPIMPVVWDDVTGEASVTEISWNGKLQSGPRKVPFKSYWNTATKKVYGGISSFIIDVAGTTTGNARVNELQRLLRRKAEISLDVGIRNEHDAYDCFTMGAWEVIACTWSVPSIEVFRDIIDMTDRCVPCLCHEKSVVWGKEKGNPARIEECVTKLKEMGYGKIAFMDLWGLGKGTFRGEDLILRIKDLGVDVIAGGGISLANIQAIRELGAIGALTDPFAPEMDEAWAEEGKPI